MLDEEIKEVDLLDKNKLTIDEEFISIRPKSFKDFVGQDNVCDNLSIFIQSAKTRNDGLDHILLYGPPGLGKTTIASIVSQELEVGFKAVVAPILTKASDLASILSNLEKNDVLFIDEIHRLPMNIEELLYGAMEDFKLDIIVGEGIASRSVKIDLNPFTLIGATTRSGSLSTPLRDRFGIMSRLEFYSDKYLADIIKRTSTILNVEIIDEATIELAKRSRGTPRIANRLLKRVVDFYTVNDIAGDKIEIVDINNALNALQIDSLGLDALDRKYIFYIKDNFNGGPVGVDTIATALSESRETIEDMLEPFLIQQGLVARTPRGRVLTDIAYKHIEQFNNNKKENI
ncbi:MAG: Holliday junction branch migration DNA helicase RuvB [Alphaproteobacteria bacterium]|nr:Holliday junction branch migration DNA helicase RuvB [Alphaproteobacteria bacterium]MBL0718212.1 Holliday junction branch migration DNA helicase RuvB [Alphaproteobacteria bacterium]